MAATLFAPVVLLSLPWCAVTLVKARRDLVRMAAGRMDPRGAARTNAALGIAWLGVTIGLVVLGLAATLLGALWLWPPGR
jgi:hypothetical protein